MPTNKFHYIWMGRMPIGTYEDSFKDGPNSLAKQLNEYMMEKNQTKNVANPQDQEIIMWVPEDLIKNIKENKLLDPTITLKPVEDLYENTKYLSKKEKENLKTTVKLLGKYNAYASQKDILSAAILEEYGGYFLDTTTEIDSIKHLINNQPKDIWFPRLADHAGKQYDGDGVILPDIWAMYNPIRGGSTFKGMLNSYVQRCQFYFPEEFKKELNEVKLVNGDFKSGYSVYNTDNSYGTGSMIMTDNAYRDSLIGQTAIFSFLDGLKRTKGPLTKERMFELSSCIKYTKNGVEIEQFGIKKYYKGTWRNQAIVAKIEDNKVEDRLESELETKVETLLSPQARFHLFPVKEHDFNHFKLKYQALKGDHLKTQILRDFEEKLSTIPDKETFDQFIVDFKKSTDYKILITGQGITTRLFSLETTSKQKVDDLIKTKEAELLNQSVNNISS